MFSLPVGSIPLQYFVDHAHLEEQGQQAKASFVADHITALINKGVIDLERFGTIAAEGAENDLRHVASSQQAAAVRPMPAQ